MSGRRKEPYWSIACRRAVLILGIFGTLAAGCLRAANAEGNRWAILIGAERYFKAPNLVYVLNDVRQISATLQQRGDYAPQRVLEMTDTATAERFQPLQKSILAELPRWLQKVPATDQVLVYFTGHGYCDPDGRLYLAPLDIDPAKPADAGVPVAWLREQLTTCRAKVKVLIIDACHAGADKGGDAPQPVTSKEIVREFAELTGVATLASCSERELSRVWVDVEQSLFSYWLNLGLRGHADRDGDCDVDIDELFEYVYVQVKKTAPLAFKQPQTPARRIEPTVPGVPTMIRVTPISLKATLQEMAEQLASEAHRNKLSDIGVPAFTPNIQDAALAEKLGGQYGLMPRYCANELTVRLERELRRRDKNLRVLPHEAVNKVMADENLTTGDLQTAAVRDIEVDGVSLRAVALGQFCLQTGKVMTLQCLLKGTGNVDQGRAGGTALLTESEWAMLGKNGELVSGDKDRVPTPPGPKVDNPTPPEASIGIGVAALEDSKLKNHDPQLPVEVGVVVNGNYVPWKFVDGEEFIPLAKGSEYVIRVKHRFPHTVFVRVLVDGLNTLPEGEQPAQRVNLAEARAWVMKSKGTETLNGIYGFYGKMPTKDEETGDYRGFKVVDGNQARAAEQGFSDQIGLITAAFYAPAPKRGARTRGGDVVEGSVATNFGNLYTTKLGLYDGDEMPGDLIAVVHIRYVTPEEYRRLNRS